MGMSINISDGWRMILSVWVRISVMTFNKGQLIEPIKFAYLLAALMSAIGTQRTLNSYILELTPAS